MQQRGMLARVSAEGGGERGRTLRPDRSRRLSLCRRHRRLLRAASRLGQHRCRLVLLLDQLLHAARGAAREVRGGAARVATQLAVVALSLLE